MTMRKVALQNSLFCADKAGLFQNLMDDNKVSPKQQKKQVVDFENCLGKHTDSLEHAIAAMHYHINMKQKQSNIFDHDGDVNTVSGSDKPVYEVSDRGEQYLLSQKLGSNEPVYDTPTPRPATEQNKHRN